MGLNAFSPTVVFEPVRKPLGNEDEFLLPSTLGLSKVNLRLLISEGITVKTLREMSVMPIVFCL